MTSHAAVVNNAAVATHLTISCVKSQWPRPGSPSIRSTIVLHKSAFVYTVFGGCPLFFGAASGNGPTLNAHDIATDGGQIKTKRAAFAESNRSTDVQVTDDLLTIRLAVLQRFRN